MTKTHHHKNVSIEILIDWKNTNLSLFEILGRVEQYKSMAQYSEAEIYLDGDRHAIVAKREIA